jgi:competence protein ComFA
MAFVCERCQNQDPLKIGLKNGQLYCRACIEFFSPPWQPLPRTSKEVTLTIPYALTKEQFWIANQILRCYQRQQSVMVDAVTGSGKTELIYPLIQRVVSEGKRIGFVVPRTDVVREMLPRFQKVFPTLSFVTVYGGHHDVLEADLIILTTHQIYRYEDYFDALIFDEVDAFPYQGNPVLEALVKRATKGIIVYLSATFTKEVMHAFKLIGGQVFHLFKRFHGFPIPGIQVHRQPFFLKWIHLIFILNNLQKTGKPVFVFVPTIALGRWVSKWIKLYHVSVRFAFASSKNREQDVDDFKKGKYKILVTTSILERGITLANLQVILFGCDHPLMHAATLVQMAGRVGRKKESPHGHVIALVNHNTTAITEANAKIQFANQHL